MRNSYQTTQEPNVQSDRSTPGPNRVGLYLMCVLILTGLVAGVAYVLVVAEDMRRMRYIFWTLFLAAILLTLVVGPRCALFLPAIFVCQNAVRLEEYEWLGETTRLKGMLSLLSAIYIFVFVVIAISEGLTRH